MSSPQSREDVELAYVYINSVSLVPITNSNEDFLSDARGLQQDSISHQSIELSQGKSRHL